MKKRVVFMLAVIFIGIGAAFLYSSQDKEPGYCAFCDSEVLERQVFYQDELVYALYTALASE